MEFFRIRRDIPFMRYGKITTAISLLTFLFAVWALTFKGLNLGIDFTGGTLIEVTTSQPANIDHIRTSLDQAGFRDVTVQNFGASNDVLIRLPVHGNAGNGKTSEAVMNVLHVQEPGITLKRVDFVGPQVGHELYDNGALALMVVAGEIG
ncbi:MAG: protein translocase subunit SecF, partial [Betaproteobacteria bacterium]|nr:protein translocase subunit SecF [Betaproteobacteria bacterium]